MYIIYINIFHGREQSKTNHLKNTLTALRPLLLPPNVLPPLTDCARRSLCSFE